MIGRPFVPAVAGIVVCAALTGCSGGGSSGPAATSARANAAPSSVPSPQSGTQLVLPAGFTASIVAHVSGARELAALPNGDLLAGTASASISIVPAADGPGPTGTPGAFATLAESPAEGLAVGAGAVYAATTTTIWKLPYAAGARNASATAIARVRTGPVAPNSDGDVHVSTSVAVWGTTLYAGVGSSCNACIESDATRASVQRMSTSGAGMTPLALRTRNPIALAIDPASGALWIGGAGQDGLPYGHPYEYLDSPTLRGTADVDYGWPECEENHVRYDPLHVPSPPDCSRTVAPAIVFPAYATLVGAAFYPANQSGAYAFPAPYRGGIFVTAHGSWHCCPATPPRVFFVPMHGDVPATPVDWSDPTRQSVAFASGFGTSASNAYDGRPTGVAIGPNGSLFVADDATGSIYRIRPR